MTVSSSSSSKENAADHLQVSCPAACSYLEGRRSNTPNVDDDDDVFLVPLQLFLRKRRAKILHFLKK